MDQTSDGYCLKKSKQRKRKREVEQGTDMHEDSVSTDIMADLQTRTKRTSGNAVIKEHSESEKHIKKNKSHKRIRKTVEDTQPREHMDVLDAVTGHVKPSFNEEQNSGNEENTEHGELNPDSSRTKFETVSSEKSSKVTKEVALEYLHSWNNQEVTGDWSFKKKTQYWLLQSMYHKSKVPKPEFEILLKYLEGLKGHQKDLAIDKAKQTIEKEEGN